MRGIAPERVAKIEAIVEKAFMKIQPKGRGNWVSMADMRDRLGALYPRDEIDRVIKEMSRHRRVHIAPESNRKTLTQRDHNAAISIGGLDAHILMFQ